VVKAEVYLLVLDLLAAAAVEDHMYIIILWANFY